MNDHVMIIKKSIRRLAVSACLVGAMVGSVAFAESVHLKGGHNAEPSFSDGGLTLSVNGELSGLGEGDIEVELRADGQVDSTCTNPGGGTEPAGHNPAEVTFDGVVSIPDDQDKNGNVHFSVTTEEPESAIPGAPGCPNVNWTQTIDEIHFTEAWIEVSQGGESVLQLHCSFDPATSNGSVPRNDVECTPM